jgi:IS30 family transposase
MDRTLLEQLLSQGLSLQEIGRRLDRHESTIAYWLEKHGLRAVNRAEHSARAALHKLNSKRWWRLGCRLRRLPARFPEARRR